MNKNYITGFAVLLLLVLVPFSVYAAQPTSRLTMDTPNGGQNWQIGTIQSIKWHSSSACGNEFKVELLHSRPGAGSPVVLAERVRPRTERDSRGGLTNATWDWAIVTAGRGGAGTPRPQFEAGSDYRIRVTSTSGQQCTVMSGADFTLSGTGGSAAILTIQSPNGGERFDGSLRGLGGGGSVSSRTGGTRSILGISSALAAAYDSRSGGTQMMTVRWKSTEECRSDDVRIELLKIGEAGNPIRLGTAPIGRGEPGQVREGSWTARQGVSVPGGTYRVNVGNKVCTDMSDGTIEIAAQDTRKSKGLTVVDTPNGGQNWQIGTIQSIKWHSSSACGNDFKVELLHSRPGAGSPVVLADRVRPRTERDSSGGLIAAWDWAILTGGRRVDGTPRPQFEAGSDYRIRVTSTSGQQCTAMSGADFTLSGTGGRAAILTIQSPNGGERFDGSLRGLGGGGSVSSRTGGTRSILGISSAWAAAYSSPGMTVKWKSTEECGSDNVSIELSKIGEAGNPVKLGTAPIGRGEPGQEVREGSWTAGQGVPVPVPAGEYRVKVGNRMCADTSDGTIEISAGGAGSAPQAPGGLIMDTPNGGQNWQIGTIQSIKWHSSSACGNDFKVELLHSRPGAGSPVVLADRVRPRTERDSSGGLIAAWDWAILTGGRRVDGTPRPQFEAGSDYRIRVTSTSGQQCTDMSGADFTLSGTGGRAAILTIQSPNGGERFDGSLRGLGGGGSVSSRTGGTRSILGISSAWAAAYSSPGMTVKWKSTEECGSDNVSIELSKIGEAGNPVKLGTAPIGRGEPGQEVREGSWTAGQGVPVPVPAGEYRVKVGNRMCADTSDGTIEISAQQR